MAAGQAPGGGCVLSDEILEVFSKGDTFVNHPSIKKRFGKEADTLVKQAFQDVWEVEMDVIQAAKIDKGRLKTFQGRLDRIINSVESGTLNSRFGSTFYAPTSLTKGNPQLTILMDKLHNVSLSYNGRKDRHNRYFKNMLGYMQKEMIVNGIAENMPKTERQAARSIKKINKEADKLERDIENSVVELYNAERDGDTATYLNAKAKLNRALEVEEAFYVKGEGRVFNEFLNNIETVIPKMKQEKLDAWRKKYKELDQSGKRLSRKDFETTKARELKLILSDKIKSEPMLNAVSEYITMMDGMHTVLTNGVKAYVKTIKESMRGRYNDEAIDVIAEKIYKKIEPDKKTGYYPHYRRVLNSDYLDNLMPHMQNLSDALSETMYKNKTHVDEAVDALNTYVSGRTKSRKDIDLGKEGVDAQNEYSRNFISTVKRYVDEVDRFNMIAHSDLYTRQSLNAAKELFKNGEPFNDYASSTVKMMKDMNARMKGSYKFENENTEKIIKTMLAFEFASKIGFSPRSAVKNLTQGFLNLVEFTPGEIRKSKDFYENNRQIRRDVEDMMDESGFLFAENLAPELLEGQFMGKGFTQKIKITNGETIELKKPSKLSTVYEYAQKGAGFSGKMMGKIENINRKMTFKVAFSKLYNELHNSTAYKTSLREQGKSEKEIEAEIKKRARNYAIRKTTLIHFDYADLSKASWTTHPAGRLLGQFQHYAIKMWEYNHKLASEAKDDIVSGQLMGDRAKKAYGMGLIYFGVPAIVASLTGLDVSNMFEHSPSQQINKLTALFTGDEDEIKDAYYGKGILTGLPFIGAPVVSDAISIGAITGFLNLDDDTLDQLIIGNQDYARATDDQKTYGVLKVLNSASSRVFYKHWPNLRKAKLGKVLTDEMGFYSNKESRESQQNFDKALPEDIDKALKAIGSHQEKATKRKLYPDFK